MRKSKQNMIEIQTATDAGLRLKESPEDMTESSICYEVEFDGDDLGRISLKYFHISDLEHAVGVLRRKGRKIYSITTTSVTIRTSITHWEP